MVWLVENGLAQSASLNPDEVEFPKKKTSTFIVSKKKTDTSLELIMMMIIIIALLGLSIVNTRNHPIMKMRIVTRGEDEWILIKFNPSRNGLKGKRSDLLMLNPE